MDLVDLLEAMLVIVNRLVDGAVLMKKVVGKAWLHHQHGSPANNATAFELALVKVADVDHTRQHDAHALDQLPTPDVEFGNKGNEEVTMAFRTFKVNVMDIVRWNDFKNSGVSRQDRPVF